MIRIASIILALCITSAALAEHLLPYKYTQNRLHGGRYQPLDMPIRFDFAKTQRPPQPRAAAPLAANGSRGHVRISPSPQLLEDVVLPALR